MPHGSDRLHHHHHTYYGELGLLCTYKTLLLVGGHLLYFVFKHFQRDLIFPWDHNVILCEPFTSSINEVSNASVKKFSITISNYRVYAFLFFGRHQCSKNPRLGPIMPCLGATRPLSLTGWRFGRTNRVFHYFHV